LTPLATAEQPNSAVSLRGVGHAFGATNVLDRIDLEIEQGEFLAIVGPSGCGKSTLLRLIAGLNSPSAGAISVADAALALVFQDAHLLPWRTVLDNVALPLELVGIAPAEAKQRASAALGDVELSHAIQRFPDELSGGMRMRVSIARAFVTEPKLLLLDEPFAALDELTRQRLDERLRALWQQRRMTVVLVTHSLAEAAFLADRAVVMSQHPARIVLDHRLNLPTERKSSLRTTADFSREIALLTHALEAHGSADEARA